MELLIIKRVCYYFLTKIKICATGLGNSCPKNKVACDKHLLQATIKTLKHPISFYSTQKHEKTYSFLIFLRSTKTGRCYSSEFIVDLEHLFAHRVGTFQNKLWASPPPSPFLELS